MSEIRIPKWGLTVDEVVLLEWLKAVGDAVAHGEAVAIVETDKVTTEIVSEEAGRITELLAQEGQELAVGDVIARLVAKGETDA